MGPSGVAAPDILERVQQLLSLLLYPNRAKRADAATLAANTRGQNGLWGYGISGDYPILLVRVADESDTELLQEVLLAHRYWRRRGLQIELLILNQQHSSYDQQFHDRIGAITLRVARAEALEPAPACRQPTLTDGLAGVTSSSHSTRGIVNSSMNAPM